MELIVRQNRKKSDSGDTVSMKNIYTWKEMEAEGRREEKQQARHFVMEDYQVCQAWHPRGEFMLSTHDFPVLPVPANGFQDEWLHYPSRDWGDAAVP